MINPLSAFGSHVWSISSEHLRALGDMIQAVRASGIQPPAASMGVGEKAVVCYNGGNPLAPEIDGDTATVEIIGCLVARAPWWAKAYADVVDPFDVADVFDSLAANPDIKRVVVELDCPGGTTAGTQEASFALRRMQAAGKRVEVVISGCACSAGYWIACYADSITGSPTSMEGCLGTYVVLCDSTAAASEMGYKLEKIASNPRKGEGADGAITPTMREQFQAMVNSITAEFAKDVAAARKLTTEQTVALFTGDWWLSADALSRGLIDAVASVADEIETQDGQEIPPPPIIGGEEENHSSTMAAAAVTLQEPHMALDMKSLAAISAEHPTHSALILAEAAKDGATIEGVKTAVAKAELKAKDDQIAALAKRADEAEAKAKAEAEAKAKAEAALTQANAQLKKFGAHAVKHEDPGNLEASGKKTITRAEFDAMDAKARSSFFEAGGVIAE